MINIYKPRQKLPFKSYDFSKYLDQYCISYDSNPNCPGYILFEPVNIFDIVKIPDYLTKVEYNRVQTGKAKLLLFLAREPVNGSIINGAITEIIEQGIPAESIVLVTGNFGLESLSSLNDGIKVLPFFIFDMRTLNIYKGRDYISCNPSKTYLCFNSVIKLHRTILNVLLDDKKGYISYLKRQYKPISHTKSEIDHQTSIDPHIKHLLHRELESAPKTLDMTLNECINDQFDDDISLYDDTAFSIVTESLYCDKSLFITEKTFKPILSMHPFLILSSPGIHTFLENFGYQNYNFLFPEISKIDNEPDVYKRSLLIKDVVDNFSIVDYLEKLPMIKEIAEHNKITCVTTNYKERIESLLDNL